MMTERRVTDSKEIYQSRLQKYHEESVAANKLFHHLILDRIYNSSKIKNVEYSVPFWPLYPWASAAFLLYRC
jgi:hypothetical protein